MKPINLFRVCVICVFAIFLAYVGCSKEDKSPTGPGEFADVVSILNIEVMDETSTPPETLYTDTFTVTYENNYMDFWGKAIKVPINNTEVTRIQWTSPNYTPDIFDNLYYVTFPADIIGTYAIGRIPVSCSMTPPINVSSFGLFHIGLDGAQMDTITLSLFINNEPVFEDSSFIFENIHLTKAIATQIPLIKQGQTARLQYSSDEYCFNINPDFRDPRNIHSMIFIDGIFACGATIGNIQGQKALYAFFMSFEEIE